MLTFTSEQVATIAQQQISDNMSYPKVSKQGKQVTELWANIYRAVNGELWFFVEPESKYMNNVVGHTVQENNMDWYLKTEIE